MNYSLVPSLPAASFEKLEHLAASLKGTSKGFQIDIVDGKFVPHTSWPFTEKEPVEELQRLRPLVNDFEVEVDCMVMNPEQYIDILAELGVARVIIHVGSTDIYSNIVSHAQAFKYKLGFAFTNDVPLTFLYPYIEKINFVQIMGIAHVGQQGQPFDERTLENARTLREKYPELEIAVDGSVNAETLPRLVEAGVNRFAPGSAISKAEDPVKAYKQLEALIKS